MKEKPILFSGDMVRAILDGSKTQTRRVIKPPRDENVGSVYQIFDTLGEVPKEYEVFGAIGTNESESNYGVEFQCPYGGPGTHLWLRETWRPYHDPELWTCVQFRADMAMIKPRLWTEDQGFWCDTEAEATIGGELCRWRPSIHMPRWASRITLEVKDVRVERLQDISQEDAKSEGINYRYEEPFTSPSGVFMELWDKINGKPRKDGVDISWKANPWVWVVQFERIQP